MFLPTNQNEMRERGWTQCDFILVSPDAYVDHPSFAMAILGRFLEKNGLKVGILPQPRWQNPQSFLELGVPRLAWGVSGGNIDSMVLNFTSNMKRRNEDEYCDEGNSFFPGTEKSVKNKIRPDRAVTVYCNLIRQVSKGVPIIIGGIEASLRRLAHYDYWSNTIKRSVLFDAKADILIYGMGEYPLLELLQNLENNVAIENMRIKNTALILKEVSGLENPLILPSFDEVKSDKKSFAKAFADFYQNNDRQILAQKQDTRYLVQFPRRESTETELDFIYSLDFERKPHPRYHHIPAFEMIKDSITAHRGCYGKCSFCAIHSHQGTKIVSRSQKSIFNEIKKIAQKPDFKSSLSDIGGPSANMYASYCKKGGCENPNCLNKNGETCPFLVSGIEEYSKLLSSALKIKGIKNVFIGSGLRFDPILMDEKLLTQILKNHSSGQIKIAPESGSDSVLKLMNKPLASVFQSFKNLADKIARKEQISRKIIPYIIVGHPGEGEKELEETLKFLKTNQLEGNQFQIFTPTPMTLSSAIYYLEFNPLTGEKIKVEKNMKTIESWKEKLVNRKK